MCDRANILMGGGGIKSLCMALWPCLGALAATPLEIDKSGASIVGSTAEYADVVLHGDYVIGEGAAVTNVGTLLDIGPDAGDDATFAVRDGGQYVGVGGEQLSKRRMVIGRNGGRGKIVVSDVKQRDQPSWAENNSRFSSEAWNLALSADADASSDTMDIVQIDTNAFFSIGSVSNFNTAVKARILFNGGTYYQRHRCSTPFNPVIGSEIILEATEGNDVHILRKAGMNYAMVRYSNVSGLLRFSGLGDVILEGAAGEGPASSIRPGFTLTECCRFEQFGDLVIAGTMVAQVDSVDVLPYGEGIGGVVLRDETAELRISGRNAHRVNALLGCGTVSNSSESAALTFNFSNETDRVLSETISPLLTWLDSAGGYECVKYGSGAWLADSTPSVPKLTVAQGSVRVTADAAVANMKGKVVEFRPGTSLSVEAGTWSPETTLIRPQVAVSIAEGGTYRATGDSSLIGADIAPGATIEKAGDGTLTIYESDAPYSGTLRVLGGTVRLSARGDANDFWRLTIRQSSGSSIASKQYVKELACIGLFSATDTTSSIGRLDTVEAAAGTPAGQLAPGSISIPAGISWTASYTSESRYASLAGLMDSRTRYAHYTFPDSVAKRDDESTWLPITIRLKEDHVPVDSFRLIYGWPDLDWCAQSWILESSPDGSDGSWQVRAEHLTGGVLRDATDGCAANEYVTGYARDGAAGLAENSVLRVDCGATLDLGCVAVGSAPCGGLEFDCTSGGGTLTRFEPVPNGCLRILNFPKGEDLSGYVLPLSFGSVLNASNLSSWKVIVDGEESPRVLEWVGGKIRVAQKGMVIVVR